MIEIYNAPVSIPHPPLRPASVIEKAHMRAWRQHIDEVPTPSIRYLSFNTFFVPKFAHMSDEPFRATAESLPLRRDFYLKVGRTGFPQVEVDAALRRLRDTLERMERALARTEWLAHDMFTLADISVMPSIVWLADMHRADLWADLPFVARWYARIQARPAFTTTYYAGTRDVAGAI